MGGELAKEVHECKQCETAPGTQALTQRLAWFKLSGSTGNALTAGAGERPGGGAIERGKHHLVSPSTAQGSRVTIAEHGPAQRPSKRGIAGKSERASCRPGGLLTTQG